MGFKEFWINEDNGYTVEFKDPGPGGYIYRVIEHEAYEAEREKSAKLIKAIEFATQATKTLNYHECQECLRDALDEYNNG